MNAEKKVVVRFAPSPTGMFHVGSARTALFNWMWAKRTGGTFLLRIEDTDTNRNTDESLENILESMRTLGLEWDGETYHSSAHRSEHVAAAEALVAAGMAYHCSCTREEVDARGTEVGSGYDGYCRDRSVPAEGTLVRLRNPGGPVSFEDAVLGTNTTNAGTFGDFPLVKSSGEPLFLLGNVYDDAAMGVTWVIRGADHLPNHPKYLLVWEALRSAGVIRDEPPTAAHLPLIVGPAGKKLSKRRDKVAVSSYLDGGILPSALLTYLSNLGWGAPDGLEKADVEDLVPHFDIHRVGVSNAVMDEEKLRSVNAAHLTRLWEEGPDRLARTVREHLHVEWELEGDPELLAELPSRMKTLADARELLEAVYSDVETEEKAAAKWLTGNPTAPGLLGGFLKGARDLPWESGELHALCSRLAEEHGLGLMKATMPIRVAALRREKGMPLFAALAALGRERTVQRLEGALEGLSE